MVEVPVVVVVVVVVEVVVVVVDTEKPFNTVITALRGGSRGVVGDQE